MHTDQPAIFVTVCNVIQFIDKPAHKIKFFVLYEVKSEIMTAKMTLDAGEMIVDYKTICENESQIINWKTNGTKFLLLEFHKTSKLLCSSSVYRNLLAVTSTSDMVQLTVKFEKPPKLQIQDFLKLTLGFSQLTYEDNDVDTKTPDVSCFKFNFDKV